MVSGKCTISDSPIIHKPERQVIKVSLATLRVDGCSTHTVDPVYSAYAPFGHDEVAAVGTW